MHARAPVAQLDRAPDFESVGRRFESCRARLRNPNTKFPTPTSTGAVHSLGIWNLRFGICDFPHAPLAQLDRASASGAEGHRFESCRARHSLRERLAAAVFSQAAPRVARRERERIL